ncbi:hypothetical protein [Streptomyces sp. N35]|uniref:hypothetical protein n=1 Tax=Streptomyces sp. N35 TaxID=2795730 RepID=UPI0018F3DA6A|nr:hypothetical protein [Streptomyces sp. N35]
MNSIAHMRSPLQRVTDALQRFNDAERSALLRERPEWVWLGEDDGPVFVLADSERLPEGVRVRGVARTGEGRYMTTGELAVESANPANLSYREYLLDRLGDDDWSDSCQLQVCSLAHGLQWATLLDIAELAELMGLSLSGEVLPAAAWARSWETSPTLSDKTAIALADLDQQWAAEEGTAL